MAWPLEHLWIDGAWIKAQQEERRFKLSKVAYMGYVLGADGLEADPEKIPAICEMPHPTDVQRVQRLIGVVTYLSKFCHSSVLFVNPSVIHHRMRQR